MSVRWLFVFSFIILLVACSLGTEQDPLPDYTESIVITPTIAIPTASSTPTQLKIPTIPRREITPTDSIDGPIGIGLREQTIDILMEYRDCSGLTMAASSELAERYFPQLEGWIRVIGAPSLIVMQDKAERAMINDLSYEALGYGLETSSSTPDEEWKDLIASTLEANTLADAYDKLLVMGPGFQLMSRNEEKYASMASITDIWMLQTQQLQKEPPGYLYRKEVERIVKLIRSDHPDLPVWTQITLPPDRAPDAGEWLEYRSLIADLVDGTYIGVYTWDTVDNELLLDAVSSIFETICGSDPLK